MSRPSRRGGVSCRVAFGLLWIFDGLLQIQAQMPIGLATQVISPTETGQPHWLASAVNFGVHIWQNHPVESAVAVVWVQVGIGLWLLVAPRGRWSRLGAVASIAWALVVWLFGEGLGMVLTPSASFLFGAPGAVLFYAAAGALLALRESAWQGPKIGRRILRAMGVVFLGGAALQAVAGRGNWNGTSLSSMASQMSAVHQPHVIASLVSAFGRFAANNGLAVNVFVIIALSAVGLGLLTQKLVRASFIGAVVLCAAIWVLVEDCGFFGGVGTDPNSGWTGRSTWPMRIIAVSTLREFWSRPGRHDAEQPLRAWVHIIKAADWSRPTDVKSMFRSVDILGNDRVVFNIGGNKYRLVVAVHYRGKRVYIRFIGTHGAYDRIDAETV